MVPPDHRDRSVGGRGSHWAGGGAGHRAARPGYAARAGAPRAVPLVGADGQAYPIRWSRPGADGGTTFTTPSGQVMTFARGQVWVVLTAAQAAACGLGRVHEAAAHGQHDRQV